MADKFENQRYFDVTVERSTVYRVLASSEQDATDRVLAGEGEEVDQTTAGTSVAPAPDDEVGHAQ